MSTDPFVPSPSSAKPRHAQNQPAGIAVPPARPWRAARPGEVGADGPPQGARFGSPAPNAGYALTLAKELSSSWHLGPAEHLEDAETAVADLAMKRAGSYGRGPARPDVDVAIAALGYDRTCADDFVARRTAAVHEVAHLYQRRRALVDGVDIAVLRGAASSAAGAPVDSVLPAHHAGAH